MINIPFEWLKDVDSPWVPIPEPEGEEMDGDEIKRVIATLDGYQQSNAHFQGATEQQLRDIRTDIKETRDWAIRTDERLNQIEARMLNGYSHRLQELEAFAHGCSDEYVRLDTFNQANLAIRQQLVNSEEKTVATLNQVLGQVKQFKWFLGTFATMFLALIAWVVSL